VASHNMKGLVGPVMASVEVSSATSQSPSADVVAAMRGNGISTTAQTGCAQWTGAMQPERAQVTCSFFGET